ncbi:MAG: hypothetical protein IPP72_21445 [Chitinophagaceae bacterium]|nr:hypothetical protein [Chitinophagaceae bacterium]
MNKLILLTLICFSTTGIFAQVKKDAVQPAPAAVVKVVPIVPTKELKKQLERNFKRKRYAKVVPIADTLLKRNPKDENVFYKRSASKIYLKMDKSVIADFKGWFKKKDSAAMMIAFIPYQFDFKAKKRNGDVYFKSAMAHSPKSGTPQIMYAAQLADDGKMTQAIALADKGYVMLSPAYKKVFVGTYAEVLHAADRKTDAYKLMEDEFAAGNKTEENLRTYFKFYSKDKRYDDGIGMATAMLMDDSSAFVLSRRALLNDEKGDKEKACEDAMLLKTRFQAFEFLSKQFGCPQVMADITPTQQRTYIYEVVFQGQTYDFRVTNPIVDMSNGVSFKFKMTGDIGFGGLVNISKDAINTAHKQNNRFSNGDLSLEEETTVWVSNAVYNDIKTKGETFITADIMGEKQYEVINDEYNDDDEFYTVKVDEEEKYIKCVKIGSKDGDEEIWINDDPKNPLILKMKLSFSIELKQIL